MHAKTILHVGPGHRSSGAKLPAVFQSSDWREIRLDIDPANEPDIVGSMLDMAAVTDASVDAIYSAHNIEHIYAQEVPIVLNEFLRVLKPGGFLVVACPDLQTVCQLVAEDKLIQTVAGKRRLRGLDLWVVASKSPLNEDAMRELANRIQP